MLLSIRICAKYVGKNVLYADIIYVRAAEVYPVRGSLSKDPTKRSKSRYESDFVWNQNWKEALEYQDEVQRQLSAKEMKEQDDSRGFLSLSQKVDLNDMTIDLSSQLRPKQPPNKEKEENKIKSQKSISQQGYPTIPPSRIESKSWGRGARYSINPVAPPPSAGEAEEAAARLEIERERYEELKRELQQWAVALTAACLAATYVFYGREVAASYGVGALGGLFYLRLLSKSVDAVGAGGLGGALGQPRLLIPVILTLGYNRFNHSPIHESLGLTLQLLPMLAGFFTYKGAVISRQAVVLFGQLSSTLDGGEKMNAGKLTASKVSRSNFKQEASSGERSDVTSVDRAFTKRILEG
jgi:ATP synthase protein I